MLRAVGQRFPNAAAVLIKFGIVAGALAACFALGQVALRVRPPTLLPALGLLPVVGMLLLRYGRLEHAVLGIVVVAAGVRFTLPTGTQSRIVMSLLVTGLVLALWIGRMLVQERRLRLQPAPTNLPLLGFVLVCAVAYVWSNVFRDLLVVTWASWPFVQLAALVVMVLLPAAYLLTANVLSEVRWLVWLSAIFLAIGSVSIAATYLKLPLDFLQVRPLFPTWVICLSYSLALFGRRLPWWARLALLLLAGAWLYHVFVRQFQWLSAWLPSIAALGLITLLRSRTLVLVLLACLCVFVFARRDVLLDRVALEREESGDSRLDAWQHNWRVTGQHLLFGVGPAGYAVYYMTYFPLEAMATHSTYIDVLSQTGIVGLIFFLWFFAALLKVCWTAWRQTRGQGDFAESFAVAALGGYVGVVLAMALGDWLVPFVYTQTIAGFDYAVYSWILLGAAQSLYHATGAGKQGSLPQPGHPRSSTLVRVPQTDEP